jgi:hypothetical protein
MSSSDGMTSAGAVRTPLGDGLTGAGAVRTPSGDVEELSWRMEQLPRQMRTFSRNMRSLFAENALTGEHASSRKFRRYFRSVC